MVVEYGIANIQDKWIFCNNRYGAVLLYWENRNLKIWIILGQKLY